MRARLAKPEIGHHHEILEVLVLEVVRQDVDGGQLIDRDVEEALDLALVEVHRQHPVGAGHGDHVGDQTGGDGHARLVLLVGPAVAVVRDDGRDPAGAGALEGVDHDQEFHDRVVHRPAGRLDDEHVLLTDVIEDLDEDVLVRELEDIEAPGLGAEVAGDLPGEIRVRVAVVDLELVRVHGGLLPFAGPERAAQAPRPGVSPPLTAPPAPGSSLSSLSRASASPGRKAEMPTTVSPSLRRMTMTPRAPDE